MVRWHIRVGRRILVPCDRAKEAESVSMPEVELLSPFGGSGTILQSVPGFIFSEAGSSSNFYAREEVVYPLRVHWYGGICARVRILGEGSVDARFG